MTGMQHGVPPRSSGVGPAPRRGSWLDRSTGVFLDELGQLGLVISRAQAASLIRGRLAAVADGLRVTEQSARRYIDEEVLRDLARSVAMEFAEERPGASLFHQERTIPVSTAILGRVVSGLAEAAHVRLDSGDSDGAGEVIDIVSTIGLILEDESASLPSAVLLPQAALARCARLLTATGDMVRAGASRHQLPDDLNAGFPQAFERDARTLRVLLDEYGSSVDPSSGS